ncbi:unnamed protein product [Rotaria sp. Silwood1]|nr:unnamed protein product [Rotaria sp. Silwood1]CAF1527257.1 unnamed protein product [Rotaria sp. Silwood1]
MPKVRVPVHHSVVPPRLPPPPPPPPAPSRGGGLLAGPLLLFCCPLIVLFLAAATIVLSLIPVYVEKSVPVVGLCPQTFYAIGNYPGSLGNDRYLSGAERQNLAQAMEQQLHLRSGSIVIEQAAIATTAQKRKRRGYDLTRFRRGQTALGIQRLYVIFRINQRRSISCKLRSNSLSGTTALGVPMVINIGTTAFAIPPFVTATVVSPTAGAGGTGGNPTTNVIG